LTELPVQDLFGPAMWYRVALPELLPAVSKVLYLDIDTIVLDRLAPLWELDLHGHLLAAVTNVPMPWHVHRASELGLDPSHYFNSGVLLMNLDLMRRQDFATQLTDCVRTSADSLLWPDQDALNLMSAGRRLELHPRWNCMNSFRSNRSTAASLFGEDALDEALRAPAIRHFEGPGANKPWHLLHDRQEQRLYAQHRGATPWPTYRPEGARYQPDRDNVHSSGRPDSMGYMLSELPARLEALAAEVNRSHPQRVLDYGCAEVPYRHIFADSVEYLAADLPGNPQATITLNPDGSLPLADDSVDAVLSTQVLEHVSHPGLYLRECRRVLRSGGHLLLSTHGFMLYHPDPVDLWRWTSAGLREQVTQAGFQITRLEGIMGPTASGLQLFQDGLLLRLPARLRPAFVFLVQRLIALVDRHEPAERRDQNALVFAVVAEKR
jgi:SAM-dependent methyltransferase